MDKNIITNLSLEQYKKKYHNLRENLLIYSKKDVEDFDKKYGHYVFNNKTNSLNFDKYLLKGRKWCLIKDTYYEIPRPIRFTWFRNLHVACQVGTCVLAAGVVAAAITLPIVLTRDNGETTFILTSNESGGYSALSLSLKKDIEYTFKCNIESNKEVVLFAIEKNDGNYAELVNPQLHGTTVKWEYDETSHTFGKYGRA